MAIESFPLPIPDPPEAQLRSAVCLHSGTAHGGHYHAFLRDLHNGAMVCRIQGKLVPACHGDLTLPSVLLFAGEFIAHVICIYIYVISIQLGVNLPQNM